MRVSEKTLELTICSQLSVCYGRWPFGPFQRWEEQPLWFGLTQKQEAQAGFDAATRIGSSRILILQFKAGRRLADGRIRFTASHRQLLALGAQVKEQARLVLYVLPTVTQTPDLYSSGSWVLNTSWFLDVASIPVLGTPSRKSGYHYMYLNPSNGVVEIRSDPIEVNAVSAFSLLQNLGGRYVGGSYESFDVFWKYAKFFKRNAVAAALPRQRT